MSALETSRVLVDSVDVFKNKTKKKKKKKRYKKNHLSLVLSPLSLSCPFRITLPLSLPPPFFPHSQTFLQVALFLDDIFHRGGRGALHSRHPHEERKRARAPTYEITHAEKHDAHTHARLFMVSAEMAWAD